MPETDAIGALVERVDELVAFVRSGAQTAHDAEHELVVLVDLAFADERDGHEVATFVDHVLGVALELSDDPRVGRATMHDTIRAHLDQITARSDARSRLEEQLAGIGLGLSFDCDSEHVELIRLCREGRALDPVLYTDAERAAEVVSLAADFEVIRALEATVAGDGGGGGEDWWKRLGAHHRAWATAFDALETIAWNPTNVRRDQARRVLLDLLADPHTALDAAVRIRPSWLADGHLHQALTALDRIDQWSRTPPPWDRAFDARFGAIRHAVTSLVWLAQDAGRSAEVHTLWGHH